MKTLPADATAPARPDGEKTPTTMLKVAIVTAFPEHPERPAGGVEAQVVSLVEGLSRFEDLELHVVTTAPDCRTDSITSWGNVTVHRLRWAGGRTLRHAIGPGRRQMRAYLRQLVPDVIHSHDTFGLMVDRMPVPGVFTIHGFIHVDTARQPGRLAWLRSRLWRRVERRGWSRHEHIVCISPYVRERLVGISRAETHSIENPVHRDALNVQRHDEGNRVLFTGTIRGIKNPMAILLAAGRMGPLGRRMEIRLAGGTSEPDYLAAMKALARRSGLQQRTAFLGHLSRPEVLEELAAASVFVLPSLHENAPVSIEEAMAVGVPVVASNRCGMPHMVSEGETGFLIDPHDPGQIADRIERLLADPALRQRMGENSRRIAEDRFHPDRVAERTRQLYHRIAGEGK